MCAHIKRLLSLPITFDLKTMAPHIYAQQFAFILLSFLFFSFFFYYFRVLMLKSGRDRTVGGAEGKTMIFRK